MSEINTLKIGIPQIQESVISGFDIQLYFVMVYCAEKFRPMLWNPREFWILHCTPWIPDSKR